MKFEEQNFGSSEAVLQFIREKSEDIEKAVIPVGARVFIRGRGVEPTMMVTGMILYMLNGHLKVLNPADAELVLNDGILNRMHVRIELFRDLKGQAE